MWKVKRWKGEKVKGGRQRGRKVESWKGGKVEGGTYNYESMYVYIHLSI